MTEFLFPAISILLILTVVVLRTRGDQGRADALLERLRLELHPNPDATWDEVTSIPRWDRSENQERRMILPGNQRVRSELRFDPTNAWVRADRARPGILAAFRLKVHLKNSTSLSSGSTTRLANEALTFRLREGTGVLMYLTPDYQPGTRTQVEGLARLAGVTQDIVETRLDDSLLFHWYSQGFGGIDRDELAGNQRLRAVLWALRVNAPTPRHAESLDIATLESIIPPTERLTSYDFLVIDDDLVTMVRQGGIGRQAVGEKFARLAEHVAAY